MLGENDQPQINLAGFETGPDLKRRRQMVLALTLLFTALALTVVKYRHFWTESLHLDGPTDAVTSEVASSSGRRVAPVAARKGSAKHIASAADASSASPAPTKDAILAPLQVVVAYSSGRHQTLLARNSAVHVDLSQDPERSVVFPSSSAFNAPSSPENAVVNASATEKVHFSPSTVEVLVRPVEPVYPLLAQQANVQGSVVLQAGIGKDGNVRTLQVVSGPDILTNAALEAVKQWRFKPHYQDGQAISTETRITVTFTISTP